LGANNFEQTYRLVRADGAVRCIYDYTRIIRDADGTITHYEGYVLDMTQYYEKEAELRSKQSLLQNVIDNSPSIIFAKDQDGKLILVNRQFANILHLEPDQVIGKNDYDLFPKDAIDTIRINDQYVLETKKVLLLEETLPQNDGSIKTYLSTKFPLYDEKGHIYGIGGITSDITERKQLENELREQEERLRFVLDGSRDGAWDSDITNGKAYYSPRYAEILGYAPDELESTIETWQSKIHPDDLPAVLQLFQDYLQGHITEYICEFRMQHKTGSWVWVLSRGKATAHDETGNPIRMAGTIMDITERKQMEEQLRLYKLLVENAGDGIGVATTEGTMIYANPSFRAMTSYGDDILGISFLNTYAEPVEKLMRLFQHVIEHSSWQGELTFKRSDDSTFPGLLSAFAIRNERGEVGFIVGIIRDISDQKYQQEQRVLLQEQVIEAQRAALRELSSPLIPIADNVVIMPLIGSIDSGRAQLVMETLLEGVAQHDAMFAIIDITGVQVVDTQVANALIQAAQAVQLLGAQVILTGIGPTMAQTLVSLGVDLRSIVTRGSLQKGIAYAMSQA
jgi:rsbT co-antagonist protein RsbR